MIVKTITVLSFYLLIKFFATQKKTYLSGLLPVFPLLALVSEIFVLEDSHKLSVITVNNILFIIPYLFFLALVYILLFRKKLEFHKALVLSLLGWFIVSLTVFEFFGVK